MTTGESDGDASLPGPVGGPGSGSGAESGAESGAGGPAAPPTTDGATEEPSARQRAERRRRLAEVFGDGLPEQTRDDLDVEHRASERRRTEEWLRNQRPPHHGD